MASGSSLAAHSTSAPLRKHDVFLSFCGKDTRKGFSDYLYTTLKGKGILVYRDDEDLKRGENISKLLKAIQESEYAVVVISKNYAFSKWCLKELTEIVKCKRKHHLTILPIFYHVDPSNVRNHKESFAEGLANHGEESKEEKEKWRSALKEVGDISGWHVNDSYESKIVQEVYREVFAGLNRRLSIDFKDVVGIESQVKKMMILLRARGITNDVRFIGIWGMGGIGKTTLAQVIFDNISSEFEVTCFVDDVTEKLKKFEVVHLQEQIINKILDDKDIKIWSQSHGSRVIANRLQEKKIFLVLDNVNKASQIKALAKSHNWFGQGSRVLLTSRNKQLLKGFVDEIYEVKGLNDNDALQLFCLKAFKKNCPAKNYEKLSKEFVSYAQGLPLAIEVFGSLVLQKELSIWKSTLKQLKEESHDEIWEKLKISFDSLSYSQQELFLDIACFFNGELIDKVNQYLESIGYYPDSNIEVLQDRSLLKVFSRRFKIHDLLQEMGQHIVRGKPLKDPGECSRLWRTEDIIHVLKNNTGTDAIKGILLRSSLPKSVKLSFEGFSKMKKLNILIIHPKYFYGYDTSSDEAFEHLRTIKWYGNPSKFMLSNELRVLEWWKYPLEYLPTNFEPDNLIELKIPMSNIKHLWNPKKNFQKLKCIVLRDSQNLVEMPDFSGIPNLKELDIKGTGITQLSSSVILPRKLNVLHVGGSFSKPVSLVVHGFPLCLKFLGKLNLSYCNLTDGALPDDLSCLSSLLHLDLSKNKFTRIDCVSTLWNLRTLELSCCERLKALPPKLSSWLHKLGVKGCPSLTTFSDPRDILTSSETLMASNKSLQGIYFGYNGKHYGTTHLSQSLLNHPSAAGNLSGVVKWGLTLTSKMPKGFSSLPDISGMFQRRFEVEAICQDLGDDDRNWGYALFIVYEVFEHDSCQRRGEIHEVDEYEDMSSTRFPVFVCELEVHEIIDRKVPMDYLYDFTKGIPTKHWRSFEKVPREYRRTLGKVPIIFRVPDIPSVGRNGVWVFLGEDCFYRVGLNQCQDLGLCSISISSLNVKMKECGGHLVLNKHDFEIIKSIFHLDSKTAEKVFSQTWLSIAVANSLKDLIKSRGQQNYHPLTPLFDSGDILTVSKAFVGWDGDITLEAFYFGYNGKRYRTHHWTQSYRFPSDSDLSQENLRHVVSITWGPTQKSYIPEWFTNLPYSSGMFQGQFELKRSRSFTLTRIGTKKESFSVINSDYYLNGVSGWGYALFIVYEVFELDSYQRNEEIHEVDEHGNSSSTIVPEFVCELEVHDIFPPGLPNEKARIVFRVRDIPSVGRNGVWVFINDNCFYKAGLSSWGDSLELCSISISSLNVDIKECGGRLVLKHDHSECYEIIKSISVHDLDSETLKDAFHGGGFWILGDFILGQKRKERKEQKGVEIYEEEGKEDVEICEEGEEEGVEICEKGKEEGVEICEKGEEKEGVEICCVSYLWKFFSFLQVGFKSKSEISMNGSENSNSNSADTESSSSLAPQTHAEQVGLTPTTEDVPLDEPVNVGHPQIDFGHSSHYQRVFEIGQSSHQQTFEQPLQIKTDLASSALCPIQAKVADLTFVEGTSSALMQHNQPPLEFDQHGKPVLMTLLSSLPDLVASQHPQGSVLHSNSSYTRLPGKRIVHNIHGRVASIGTPASKPDGPFDLNLSHRLRGRSNLSTSISHEDEDEDEDEDEKEHGLFATHPNTTLKETFSSGASNIEESEDYDSTEYVSQGSLSGADDD